MQEAAQIHNIHLALILIQKARSKHVSLHEPGLESIPVAKELIAKLHEGLLDVAPDQVGRRPRVERELAQVLAEAAAQVQKDSIGADTPDDFGVVGEEVDAEVEKAEKADARVWEAK